METNLFFSKNPKLRTTLKILKCCTETFAPISICFTLTSVMVALETQQGFLSLLGLHNIWCRMGVKQVFIYITYSNAPLSDKYVLYTCRSRNLKPDLKTKNFFLCGVSAASRSRCASSLTEAPLCYAAAQKTDFISILLMPQVLTKVEVHYT